MSVLSFRMCALALGFSVLPIHAADSLRLPKASPVFVMTNDARSNEIVAFERQSNGRLTVVDRFATGGRGSGGTTDPLQSQGSLIVTQDHEKLLAINSGSGTLSSFRLQDGIPLLVDQEPTGGSEPVAVAEHNGVVYVLNAGGNGAIVAFREGRNGRLHEIKDSTVRLTATHSGGSSISVSPDGRTLVVIEKVPNNIDTFPIEADGKLGSVVVNHSKTPGVFAAVFTPKGDLLVSENQPGGNYVSSISSYAINRDGTISSISQSLPTLGDGNCWNVITPSGKYVFADNSATNTIAGFAVAANGSLSPVASTLVASMPSGTTNLDIAVSTDGNYLYTLDSSAGAVSVYGIRNDGTLESLGEIEGLPKMVGFNGIAAL